MKLDFLNKVPYLCERWQEVVSKYPSAPFLTEELSDISYSRGQVDELSGCVYSWLSCKGIGTEDFVLIRLPRDARPFIAMLGVWKAGAAFTAVEDTYAPERIEAIRKDCGCRIVIDEAAWDEILATKPLPGFRRANDRDACFAIYTSGSTGKPKGVLQEYGKIKLNQASLERHPGDLIDETTCMAQAAPLNFIAAVKIFLNALYSGMHLIILTTDTVRNPAKLNEQFNRHQVNLAFLSPSILRVMSEGVATSLKTLVTGSEAANGVWFEGVRLINNYGMSEAGFHVAQFEIDRKYDVTPIGKPVFEDIRIRLLDEEDQEVPDGQAGEICFDNPFFRGYIHLPEETARVLRNGVFHSGDIGMRLPDGNIVVTGRLKTMVKINGNRVEPGEIETAMRRIPGIQDAAVRDFDGDRQQVFLCAYYIAGGNLNEETIRARLQTELPHYMIPAFFTRMESIPLNSNGKVDRFALPKPDVNTKVKAYLEPRTPEETAICRAFESVLGVERVGVNDDFFELGGDSISTALAAAELETLRVDYREIFSWKTPREIAAHLSEKGEVDLDSRNRSALERDQYLTPYQTYFYDAVLYSPTQTSVNNPISLCFPGESVEPVRLKAALETVFMSYAVFSTVLSHDEAGVPVMRHVPGRIVHPEIHEVDTHTRDMLTELIKPYRLNGELLYRCAIYVTQTHVFLDMDTCHLISDGSSKANFMSELFAAYRGEPLRQDHYYWFLENQHRRKLELEQEAEAQLLLQRFSREEYLCNPRPDLASRRTGNGRFLSHTTRNAGQLQKGCEVLRTSLNKLFVAAALIALSKTSGQSRVTVEWTFNGRDENWKKDLIGMTISSVPVAVDLAEFPSPQDLLREIDTQSALGMRYADLSLGNYGVTPGDRDRVIVVYESGFDMGTFLPEGTETDAAYDSLNGVFTRFQIIMLPTSDPDALNPFYINYNSELYSPVLVEQFCTAYNDALAWMISEAMSNDVMQRYIAAGIQAQEEMETSSRNGNAVSQETLLRLIRENENTEYGRKYGFREIHSYADYAARVPFSCYEDYEPYIERMLYLGQKNLITAEDASYYAHTSGTSGASKAIPCTRRALDILFKTVFQRVFGQYAAGRDGMTMRRGINLMESRIGYTAYGVAYGAVSETLNPPEDTPFYNALPEELIYPGAEFDRRHVKMLFALRERQLSFLMSTFSPTLYDMITYVQHHWRALCDDIEAGRIAPEVAVDPKLKKKLEEQLKPDPERAQEIRTIMAEHENDAFVPLLWPDMKLIATVGSATFAPFIDKLRPLLGPEVAVDFLGYVCSEGTIGAPLQENMPEYMLLPFSGFYEFIPMEEGAPDIPLLMDQLEIGKEYELVVTNLSGFYRYRLGDVVLVTGFHNECPMIVFSYRKNQLISMYGEKVTETALRTAVDGMAEESGTAVLDYSVYPDTDTTPGHYVVLMESDREIGPKEWPRYSEILNRKLCETHDSYRKKILQKTILPLEAKFVQLQTYALYRDLKVMGGASPNQIKPVYVITNNKQKRFFFGLLQE